MTRHLCNLAKDEEAQTTVEYALLLSLIAAPCVGAWRELSMSIRDVVLTVAHALQDY